MGVQQVARGSQCGLWSLSMWPAMFYIVTLIQVHDFQSFPSLGEILRVLNFLICASHHQFKCTFIVKRIFRVCVVSWEKICNPWSHWTTITGLYFMFYLIQYKSKIDQCPDAWRRQYWPYSGMVTSTRSQVWASLLTSSSFMLLSLSFLSY